MIVTRGYGHAKYANRTIIGSVQNTVPAFGYGTLRSVSAILPLRELAFTARTTLTSDFELGVLESFVMTLTLKQ